MKKLGRLPRKEFRARGYHAVQSNLFLLKIKKNNIGKVRVGVVVGVGVSKSAARRNFLKRQARSGLALAIEKGTDALIVISPAATKTTKKQLREELARAAANKEWVAVK